MCIISFFSFILFFLSLCREPAMQVALFFIIIIITCFIALDWFSNCIEIIYIYVF